MLPVTIGAFHDQQIQLPVLFIKDQGRVFNYRFVEPADISSKPYGIVTAVLRRARMMQNAEPRMWPAS